MPTNSNPMSASKTEGNGLEDWDLVIQPHSSLLSLQLSEIWRYRDLLQLFVRRDITSFYKQTILGPIWFFIQPLLTTMIYVLVFGNIAGLSTDGLPQILFYLCGITFWNYFSECFNKTATVFRDNAHLYGKVYFPRIITPLSIVIGPSGNFVDLVEFSAKENHHARQRTLSANFGTSLTLVGKRRRT
ncbi:MAG: ABC transporter permease [Novipirellula sp. JB048]